jgi:nucleoside-diphosphate-sugar epimerase
MDITRARTFGYNPQTSLLEGMAKTWEWFIEHLKEYEKRQNYFKETIK